MATETSSERPRLKLYQFAASGNSRIVRLVLEEKGLPFERVNIDVTKGENRTPEFLKLNPRGKVPVLIHSAPRGRRIDLGVFRDQRIPRRGLPTSAADAHHSRPNAPMCVPWYICSTPN